MDELRVSIVSYLKGCNEDKPLEDGSLKILKRLGVYAGETMKPEHTYHFMAAISRELIMAGEPLPKGLDEFLLKVLSGEVRPPPGPPSLQKLKRDVVIELAVKMAVNAGLSASRNDSSDPTSACDLVSDCLKEVGIKLGYKAVVKIWNHRSFVAETD
jgi:hypothetical protein